MGFTTVSKVRTVSGLGTEEIIDSELQSLIDRASIELNNHLNKKYEEKVGFISSWRDNQQDGNNSVFYTQNYPLGDENDDFSVGTADVTAYAIDKDGNRKDYSLDSIDGELGELVLSSAPESSENLYLEYETLPIVIGDKMIEEACNYLSAFKAELRIHGRGVKNYTLGSLKIKKGDVGEPFKSHYLDTLEKIRNKQFEISKAKEQISLPEPSNHTVVRG